MTRASTMTAAQKTTRVAIYTRKSTEEGLDQEFNTLDAQREAVTAFIASQRSEGWVALPEKYDDGGFSGSNTNRPAFRRLMSEVEAGRVDIIAVYKLDRLSRSLSDFVGLMATLRKHGVAFVSVTQQFNTTTAVGRMTLNLLASFAEFERETISERTRDKVCAARKRGMWTGGALPLGYDVRDKKLVINKEEAEQVRAIFDLYLSTGSLIGTVTELNRRGWTTKSWIAADGKLVRGLQFSKDNLRALLMNPIYVGNVRLGCEVLKGAHAAIVPQEVADAVRDALSRRVRHAVPDELNKHGVLLRGLVVCGACGSRMTTSFVGKGPRRWGYYLCQRVHKQGASACPKSRISVGKIESAVVERVRSIGRNPELVAETIAAAHSDLKARADECVADAKRHAVDLARLEHEQRNVLDAIGKGSTESMQARLADLDAQVSAARDRIATTEAERARIATTVIDEADLRRRLVEFDGIWSALFPRERARILALLIERVAFNGQTGEVELRFRAGSPVGDEEAAA